LAKKKQHIDEFFKQNLKGSELPLDGSEWDRLSKDLHKKKRRFFWWWILIPVVLAGAWFMLKPVGVVEEDSEHQTELKQTKQADRSHSNKSSSGILDSPAINDLSGDYIGEVPISNVEPKEITSDLAVANSLPDQTILSDKPLVNPDSNLSEPTDPSTTNIIQTPVFDAPWIQNFGLYAIPYVLNPNRVSPISGSKIKAKKTDFAFISPIQIGLTAAYGASHEFAGGDSSYSNYRSKNGAVGSNIEIGLRLRLTTERGLILGTGMKYQIANQTLPTFNASPALTIQIHDSIPFINLPGDTTWLPYNYRDTLISDNFRNPGRSYLTLPLLIGKSFAINSNMSFQVSVELQPKLLIGANGTTIGTGLMATNHNTKQYSPFSMSGGLQLGMNYKLNSRYMLSLNLAGQMDLLNQSSIAEFKQGFGIYGAEFTLYYRIR